MVLHPHVLRKAQKEIDKVLSRGNLPDVFDRESLPYLECVIEQTYRWNTVILIGTYGSFVRKPVLARH